MADTVKSGGRLLTDEELKKLQKIFLEMAEEVDEVCRKNNIVMMLSGGSVLGAVRHHGFIPWDDDLDINIPRKDFEKFKKVFRKELGEKYKLYAPNYHHTAIYRIGKIENPDVSLIDKFGNRHGLMLDIFPIENVPESAVLQYIIGIRSSALMWVGIRVFEYECRNNKNYHISAGKRILGKIFSFRPSWKWFDLADYAVRYPKETSLVGIPAGRGHYFKEIYRRADMLPVEYVDFEDTKMPVPNNADAYLLKLYGDYMVIPEESKRERHKIWDLQFTKNSSDSGTHM